VNRRNFLKTIGLAGIATAAPSLAANIITNPTNELSGKVRVVTVYDIRRDDYIARVDVLSGGTQYNVSVRYFDEIEYKQNLAAALEALELETLKPFSAPPLHDMDGYYLSI